MQIRRATVDDAETLSVFAARVFEETFGAMNTPEDMQAYVARSFNVERITQELRTEGSTFFIAEADGSLAAYARIAAGQVPAEVRGDRPIELVRLYVDAPHQGTGLADRLMRSCIDEAKAAGYGTMHLGVWERNPRAQSFYRKWEFTKVGEERFELGDDIQTDWIMERAL